MKKVAYKIFYIGILTFLFIILKNVNVQAASVSLSASTTEPAEGQSVTVTANVTAGAWNLQLSGAGKSETIYGYTQSNSNASDSKSITFVAGSAGTTYNFTLTGDMTDINSNNSEQVKKSIAVTVKTPVKPGEPTEPEKPITPPSTTKSKEARLSDFGITPNDFKGFKRDKTEYNVEVPNNVSKVNVYAKTVDSKAKISGTGSVSLKEGVNTVKVTVTAEAGNTKTYTLNITRLAASDRTEETEETGETGDTSSEARLKNLGIRPKDYDFSGFKKDTTSYNVEVPNDVEEVEVYAEAISSKAKIVGTGKVALKEGKNEIKVEVTAEDGKTKKTYTLNVTRLEAEEPIQEPEENEEKTKKLGLETLLIKNFNISPKFDLEIYEYTIKLTEDLSSLDIQAKSNNDKATVEIIGNEDLKQGENTITILVSNSETEEVATYQIIVNKEVAQNVVGKVEWLKPSTWGLKEKIIVGVAISLVILIIILIIVKIKLSRKEDDEVDLPGADELDRALAEHQELSEEDNEYYEDNMYETNNNETVTTTSEQDTKSDIEMAQEYFESYSRRKGKHF